MKVRLDRQRRSCSTHLTSPPLGQRGIVKGTLQWPAVERHGATREIAGTNLEAGGVMVDTCSTALGWRSLKDAVNCDMGRDALPVKAEAATHKNEDLDGTIGIAVGDYSEGRKQQDSGQHVRHVPGLARVWNFLEYGENPMGARQLAAVG
jgi:hypothetical protein